MGAIREVRGRLTERARAGRLAQATTAIADREVVTIEGTVRAPATPLTAPLSGRSCVAYHAVARLDGTTLHRHKRRTALVPFHFAIDEHRLVPFDLAITGGEW